MKTIHRYSLRMQRNKNETHPACAACKHQRKKCTVNCALAPYFPANRNREFQAVHKVFGVSNITKLVRHAKEEQRRKLVESLIWEASCRQKDPILGSYGEYMKVHYQYRKFLEGFNITKEQNQLLHLPCQDLKSVQNHLIGWDESKVIHKGKGVDNGLDFIHDHHHKDNVIMDSAMYGLDFSQIENLRSEVVINQFQNHHPPYYYSGQEFN